MFCGYLFSEQEHLLVHHHEQRMHSRPRERSMEGMRLDEPYLNEFDE